MAWFKKILGARGPRVPRTPPPPTIRCWTGDEWFCGAVFGMENFVRFSTQRPRSFFRLPDWLFCCFCGFALHIPLLFDPNLDQLFLFQLLSKNKKHLRLTIGNLNTIRHWYLSDSTVATTKCERTSMPLVDSRHHITTGGSHLIRTNNTEWKSLDLSVFQIKHM